MAEIKKISTELQLLDKFLDTSGDAGTSGQVLTSTGTGTNWVSGGSLPGGPYLPLSAGASYPLTDTLHIDSSSSGGNQAITFERSGQETYNITHGTSGLFFTHPNATALLLGLTQGGDITVYNSSSSEYVRFDQSSQSVGIGTTSPYYKTDIRFTNTDTSLSGGGSGNWGSNGIRVENTLNTVGTMAAIQLRNNDADIHIASIRRGTNDSDLGFFWEGVQKVLFENTGSATFAGDVTATANYSAGNSKIIYKAQRSGGAVAGDWSYDDATTDMSLGTSTAHSFSLKTGNTRALTINSSQNVGIGTTSPTVELHVKGDSSSGNLPTVKVESTGSVSYLKFFNSSTGTGSSDGTYIGMNGGTAYLINKEAGNLYLGTGDAINLTLKNGGNVGIGVTSPTANLHVQGSSATDVPIIRSGGFGNSGSTLELAETLVSGNMTYGFSFEQTGNGTNELLIKRHNNSQSGAPVITLSRTNNNVSMSGGLSLSLKATSSSTLSTDSGTTLTTKNYVDALTPGAGVFLPLAGGTMNNDASVNMNSGQLTSVDFIDFGIGQLNGESTSNFILKSLGDITYNVDSNNNGNSSHIFQESGSELMRIRYDGNVGIGTTSPTHKLTVNAPNDTTAVGIDFPSAHFDFSANSTSGYTTSFHMDDTATTIGSNSAGRALKFQTNNTDRLYINGNTGNVGIGTTSPGTALQVGGLDDGSNYDITVGWNAVSSQAVGTKRSALTFKTSQTGVNNEDIYKWDIAMVTAPATASSEPFGSDLAFLRSTRSSTSVDETTMILTQLGNVGIGTTININKLDVGGNINVQGGNGSYLTFNNGDANIVINNNGTGRDLSFKTYSGSSNAERMRIDKNGNVGIGTTSPSKKLEVAGSYKLGTNAYIQYDASYPYTISTLNTAAVGNLIFTAGAGSSGYESGITLQGSNTASDDGITFTAGSSAAMVIQVNGNVGIGTTNPTEKLVVQDGKVLAGHTNTRGYGFHDLSNYTYTANTGRLSLVSNGTEAVSIDSSQNVGIGTTSPGNTLHVYKNATIGVITSPTVANAGFRVQDSGANMYVDGNSFVIDTAGYLTTTGSNDFDIGTNSTSRIKIKGGGNVGIGTTNPTNKLHIQGSQATVYSSTDTGGQASAGTTINNTNTSGNTNNFSQLLFTVGTNNNSVSRIVAIRSGSDASDLAFVGKSTAGVAEYMRIKSGGNVGIGINNPSALLEVRKGSISGQIAKFSAINPHVVIESSTAGNAVLHLKPNATSSKSGQFKVTAGNGYNFRWSNDASGTAETAYMDLDTSTTGGGDLTVKGDVIAYGSPSDKKYKENIKPIESALDKAMQLQGVTFDWKDSESILEIKEDIGFIAQDVQEVLPELVRDNGKGNLSLRYQGITPILLEAIKELKAEIEELKLNNCNCNK